MNRLRAIEATSPYAQKMSEMRKRYALPEMAQGVSLFAPELASAAKVGRMIRS
jgi:hypothetical protein